MQVFDVIGIAFVVALALYEFAVYCEANLFAARWSPRVMQSPRTGRLVVAKPNQGIARTPEAYWSQVFARYTHRSLLLHSWNAAYYPLGEERFKSWPYLALAVMGTVLFSWAGLPVLTAWGIGVCGGLTAFVSRYGRDVVEFSAENDEFNAEAANAHAFLRICRQEEARQGIPFQ